MPKKSKKSELMKEKVIELLGKEEIITFGIDQGYANLGFSIINYNILTEKIKILYIKGITTPSTDLLNKRILSIYDLGKELLDTELGQKVDAIGCEKLFCNQPMKVNKGTSELKATFMLRNKSASIMKTNMVTGVFYLLSAMVDKPIFEYPPTTVKKHIVGSGRATKTELIKVLDNIIKECGVNVKTDHESDSIGIAITTAKEYCETIFKNYQLEKKNELTPIKKRRTCRNKREDLINE